MIFSYKQQFIKSIYTTDTPAGLTFPPSSHSTKQLAIMKTLLIIGAGPGGYECAVQAAAAGLDVHVVDSADHLGGTCLGEGCIPTKCLCHTAEVIEHVRAAEAYGITTDLTGFNMSQAIQRKDQIVAQLRQGIQTLMQTPGITFHNGKARFVNGDAHTVAVGEETLKADYVIVATGSVPKFLPIPGAHTPGVLTSTEMLQLTEVPQRLCVIGGGVIGLEFASIFNTLGSQVTVIEYCKEILPNFDKDIAKRLRTALKKRGIEFITGAPVTAIHADEAQEGLLHVSYEHRSAVHDALADVVLMAVGRAANVDSLNLAEAGIDFTPRGITVNEHFETSVPGVYAVGDVNGRLQLAHAATFQSYHVLDHILERPNHTDLSLVPAAVFTQPEAAMVGLTEEQAKATCETTQVRKAFYRANGRALTMDAGADGYVKLLTTPDGSVLGAHIIGAHASELIHELTLLMSLGGTIDQLCHTVHAHPSLSEVLLALR